VTLVVGSAPCWADDLANFAALGWPIKEVIAVNRAGIEYTSPIAAWATYHPEELPEWLAARRAAGGNVGIPCYSHRLVPHVTQVLEHEEPSGSSTLLGVRVALLRGALGVVVVGCRLDDQDYWVYRQGWREYTDQLQGCVRAMSGWLSQHLGVPSHPWLEALT
jgi:hypothetical protein